MREFGRRAEVTYRQYGGLKVAAVDYKASDGTSRHESQQRRRRKAQRRDLRERRWISLGCSAVGVTTHTCRLTNSTRAIISLTRVESKGFSTTTTLRDLGSAMRWLLGDTRSVRADARVTRP